MSFYIGGGVWVVLTLIREMGDGCKFILYPKACCIEYVLSLSSTCGALVECSYFLEILAAWKAF